MTRAEFHKYFKIGIDKNSQNVAYGGCPSFLPEEVDYWLNSAYYQIINNKFTGNNSLKLPFEGSVKRIQDLQNLVKTDSNLVLIKNINSNTCVLNNLFNNKRMLFVDAVLKCGNETFNVNLINHEQAKHFKETYNNKPWIPEPACVIENNSLILYIDPVKAENFSSFTLDVTYVKFPTKIENLPAEGMSEVPENVLFEIIDRAVVLALDNMESPRIQTKVQLNLIEE